MSKIFGELFFSIDPGYRGLVGKIQTQYANMQEKQNEIYKMTKVLYLKLLNLSSIFWASPFLTSSE